MISRMSRVAIVLALFVTASSGFAAETVDKALKDSLTAALASPDMGLEVESVESSEIPGMYAVQFKNGPLVYATADGKHLINGDLFSVNNGKYVNLSEAKRDTQREKQIAAVDKKDMIVFPAVGETRAHITVFTDTTCFYCQKLHKEVPELNQRGVEVRYLAFPRAGLGSEAYDQMVTAWCSKDPQATLTKLKNKQSVKPVKCDNPVAMEYELGQQVGVRGTPALILEDGKLIPGYQTTDQLMKTLGLN